MEGHSLGSARTVNHAEVRWCNFPSADRRRPAVILTRQRALADLRAVTVAPITTSVRPSPTFVPLSIEDGLFADCAVNCDAITTVPTSALGALITQLTSSKLREVHSAIRYALSLE